MHNQVTQTLKLFSAPTYHNYSTSTTSSSVRLSNGNTAGATGSSAAQIMAQRTGVSASTWAAIIARESNGQVNAYNPSGAWFIPNYARLGSNKHC